MKGRRRHTIGPLMDQPRTGLVASADAELHVAWRFPSARSRVADRRRGAVRRRLARALLHRRQRLPDRAARRRRSAHRARTSMRAVQHLRRGTACRSRRAAAAPRRPARRSAPASCSTPRSISTACSRSNADERWARVEPGVVLDELNAALQAARPALRARRLDGQPRHRRRHDGQQLERRALGALRQDHRSRARAAGRAVATDRSPHFRPLDGAAAGRSARAATRSRRRAIATVPALGADARRRDRPPLPEGPAPRRRLQPRRVRRSGRSRSI